MVESIMQYVRKALTIIAVILVFTTIGLVSITTQTKTVNLNYYGSTKTVRTLASTIDSFLLQNKIYIDENTNLSVGYNDKIVDGMQINISDKKEYAKLDIDVMKENYIPMVAKYEEVVESIPFDEETKDNPDIDEGTTQTVQEGVEGRKSTSYIVRYSDNKEINRSEIASEVLSQARNKVVEVGTRVTVSRSALVQSMISSPVDGGFREYDIALPVDQQQYAYNICKRYGIEYELFLAMMFQESRFVATAFGGNNSYGLCQIHITNHETLRAGLGINDYFDPYDNMTAGAYLLSTYLEAGRKRVPDDPNTAIVYGLNAYNMGEGAYYSLCYSKGIIDRDYSTSVINLRNTLISTGGLHE